MAASLTVSARSEMNKPPAQVRARRGPDYRTPRYDEEVWTACPPSTDRSRHFIPQRNELDRMMDMHDVHDYDEYVAKCGARRRQG